MNRQVEIHGDTRVVTLYDDSCWRQHVIEPRANVVARVKAMRAEGLRRGTIALWGYLHPKWFTEGHNGGPGECFARPGYILHAGRRWVVSTQSGGRDI